ncbi:MAG TPA: hypothetical protein VM509_09515, partial [Planctomycetota bacterium]|nr:hypothetical protein [Planctomycetota bacterium]
YHSRVDVQAYKETLEAKKAELELERAPFETAKAEISTKRQALEEQKTALKTVDYDTALKSLQAESREVEAKLKELEPKFATLSTQLSGASAELYESDLSVTTWVVMAFKSAKTSGLKVPDEAFEGGKRFVLSTSIADGQAGYMHSSQAGHEVRDATGRGEEFKYHVGTMTALSMLCRTFIDHDIEDPFLDKAAQLLVKDTPEISKDKLSVDYYYWYYASMALNQFDGPDSPHKNNKYWNEWKRAMESSVLDTQDQTEKSGTYGGWITNDRWALQGGPIYSTAINVLTLEVYYRYANAFGTHE